MIPKVVSVPVRIGLSASRLTLGLSAKLAVRVTGEVISVVQSRYGSSPPATSRPAAARPAPAPGASANGSARPVPSVVESTPEPAIEQEYVAPDDQPETPLTREAADAKTIDDVDEVVAEFADPGAQDGAGAQIDLGEPWEDYDSGTAEVVIARITDSDAAQLAVLELYEQNHKARKTVLEAASRRLKELSSPSAE